MFTYSLSNNGVQFGLVPRFRDVPEIQVVLLDRKDLPSSSAGETPLVGLAPTLSNAIFDGTGSRLTSLPLAPRGFKSPTTPASVTKGYQFANGRILNARFSGAVVSAMISP
jgi:hypothetical protein